MDLRKNRVEKAITTMLRFTGIEASCITIALLLCSDLDKLTFDAQILQHKHKTNKTIYDGANYMTLTPQVRQELGLLTEIKTSTADIKRYLSEKARWVLL
ncbi:hypothetical protein GQ600_22807 [Phytophthora cactorum]|nr:hypothetical protein GQ600_22807 [Phytophthora cactorum]